MNILFTSYFGENKGGAELSMKTLANGLKAKGHNVTIASSGKYSNLNCIRFKKYAKIPIFKLQNTYLTRFLIKEIKKNHIQILHANDRLTSIAAIHAARKCKIPVAVHFRDYWFACPISSCLTPQLKNHDVCSIRKLIHCVPAKRLPWELYKLNILTKYRQILNKATLKIAISDAVKKKLELCNIKNSIVVPNPIDIELFKNARIDNLRKNFPPGAVVLSFVGSLSYIKGIINLLGVVTKMINNNNHLYFLIVGDGELIDKIKLITRDKNRIILIGKVNPERVSSLYKASDIILVPSLWQEPFGRIVVEAMAAGRPVIASSLGGIKSIVKDGKTGFLVNTFDAVDWENKINFLINNKTLRSKMGNNAGIESEKYSIWRITALVEKEYNQLIS